MSYAVDWGPAAENELAELWLAASDRREIADAANSIDQELHADPGNAGESREGNRRIILVPPLGAKFTVDQARKHVRVLFVWKFQTHSGQ